MTKLCGSPQKLHQDSTPDQCLKGISWLEMPDSFRILCVQYWSYLNKYCPVLKQTIFHKLKLAAICQKKVQIIFIAKVNFHLHAVL
jgi:hypothetical protein